MISLLQLRPTSVLDRQLMSETMDLSSSQLSSTWCKLANFVERHMKMRMLISNTSWRFAALSPSKKLLEMLFYFASSHFHFWGRRSNGSTPTKIEIPHGITALLSFYQCSTWENFKLPIATWWICPLGMGTLSRLHIRMSSSWDGELATYVDFLPRADQ